MKPIWRTRGAARWALAVALTAGLGATSVAAEPGAERREEPGQKERGPSERKDAERAKPERGGSEEGRVVFVAGPVRNDADAKRLQDVVRGVAGVTKVSIQRGEQEGTVRLLVAASNQGAFPQAFGAARSAGFTLRAVEVNGRPSTGDKREGKPLGDDEVLPDRKGRPEGGFRPEGKTRPEGDYRREGKPGPEGDYRREGKPNPEGDYRREGKVRPEGDYRREGKPSPEGDYRRDGKVRPEGDYRREGKEGFGGDFRPDGKGKGEEANTQTLLVGPVRSNQEALQLRGILQRIQGVRNVVLKPGERPNTAIVTLTVAGEDAVARATRAMQSYRLEVRPMAVRKDGQGFGNDRREGDGKRPEGERREGEGKRPEGNRER